MLMADQNEDAISTLNNLASIARDGVKGMKSAADAAKNASLKTTLQQLAQEREGIFSELQNAVRSLGGDPEKSGTTSGAIHRGWMNLKEMVSANDDKALLEECERGEDVAKKAFIEATAQSLPAQALSIVRKGSEQVQKSHDQIKSLRNTVT
jgi:uncharacterized protein (TIGR02284 family)